MVAYNVRLDDLKSDALKTIDHIESVFAKVTDNCGRGKAFLLPDTNRLVEGLFLSLWAKWEDFTRELLLLDLAFSSDSVLQKDVKGYRTILVPYRLSELIINHPDFPKRYIEWSDFDTVKSRAVALLGNSCRFNRSTINFQNLTLLRLIRNAVAHKSDKARDQFLTLVKNPPFSLTNNQRKALTVGRFLNTSVWNGTVVFTQTITIIRDNINILVP